MPKFIRLAFSFERDTGKHFCLLAEAHKLLLSGVLEPAEQETIKPCIDWFRQHMSGEDFLAASRQDNALVWFKLVALPHISYMSKIRSIFEKNGYQFDLFQCESPGDFIYEDDWIVVVKSTVVPGESIEEQAIEEQVIEEPALAPASVA